MWYVWNDLKFSGYLSDDELPKRTGQADMSVFRDAVQDCLDYEPEPAHKAGKLKGSKTSNAADVEKFSGLRIRSMILYLKTKAFWMILDHVRLYFNPYALFGCWKKNVNFEEVLEQFIGHVCLKCFLYIYFWGWGDDFEVRDVSFRCLGSKNIVVIT